MARSWRDAARRLTKRLWRAWIDAFNRGAPDVEQLGARLRTLDRESGGSRRYRPKYRHERARRNRDASPD